MWRAIDGMRKELHDLAQRDVDTDGEGDAETVPMSNNPLEDRPIPEEAALLAPQPAQ